MEGAKIARLRAVPLIVLAWTLWYAFAGSADAPVAPQPPAPASAAAPSREATIPAGPLADNAPRPRIIPPTPSAYEEVPKESLTAWVAKVNGDPICVRFFTRRMAVNRAAAYRHFADQSGPTPGVDFWTRSYGGETPRQWLLRRTLEECVRFQVELGWGKREGLLPGTSYGEFLRALDRENERRRVALAKGEPIYGPQQYGEDEYFTYVIGNLRLRVQERLADSEFRVSKQDLQQYYESVKGRYFDRGYRVKVWAIEVMVGKGEGGAQSHTEQEAQARITEAKARLDKGEAFEEVAAAYNENGGLHEQVFDYETSQMADRSRMAAARREAAMRLSEGEVSEVLREMNTCYILKCVKKDALGYLPFEEVEEPLRRMYTRDRYEQRVDEMVKSATIKVNQAELARIETR